MWSLGRIREVIDQRLGVVDSVMDGTGVGALEFRIVRVEALNNEVSVRLILCENDRFADPVAARDLAGLLS